ncbi:MAG: hypothetical protein WBY22_10000 [Nitrososphaeraceae archaeon]|jgi:hypothetical protein
MKTKKITISIIAGIAVVLLLIGGTASTSILSTTYAQSATLGEPFFVEKGKVSGQKEIGPNRTEFTFTGNGTMNGNIEVTNTGKLVSVSKGNVSFDQGKGVIKTTDGSETANYTLIDVFNGRDFLGAQAYSTNSTGGLSFLNNILGIIKGEQDGSGNYAAEHWHWK